MSDDIQPPDEPAAASEMSAADEMTDEELRAAYEDELKRIRVDDVLIQTVVSLLNLAARRAGLAGTSDEEVDFAQVALAIEATRALLPLVEPVLGPETKQVRDALSQLQLAYARSGAQPLPPDAEGAPATAQDTSSPSARSSGRLWVPGQ